MNATKSVLVVVVYLITAQFMVPQTRRKIEVDFTVVDAIVRCPNVRCLVRKQQDAHGKIDKAVLCTVWLMADSSSRYASRKLLENMPSTEEEAAAVVGLPERHQGAASSEADMRKRAAVYVEFHRVLALSVQRFPEYLPAFVRYGCIDNDVHSDYTTHARKVCEAAPSEFMAAFRTLSDEEQHKLRTYVFDPHGCKPIFTGEAE